jgi:hypothetical protein
MRLAFVPASLIAVLAACAPGAVDTGEVPDAPDVEMPAPDPWIAEVYEPVMKEAAELDVGEFLAAHPGPEYLQSLSYDPSTAAGLAEIRNYAGLGPEHDKLLAQNGFVAVGDSPTYTFASTYLDLYFNDMPVFISADSMLHALHKSFDSMLLDFERQVLIPEVDRMLTMMHEQLGSELKGLPPELASTGRDLDLYLTVARNLLTETPIKTISGDLDLDAEVARILDAVSALQPMNLELFGAGAIYDFSQMEPRGHYEDEPALQRYFRTMIWLGRTDMAMVIYDEEGKPQFNRRALDAAFVTNHLLAASGAQANWDRVDRVLVRLIGERDSMNPQDMSKFMAETGVETLAQLAEASDETLYKALIDGPYGLQRIMSQIMYTDPTLPKIVLPRVYLLLGQRFTLDSHVFNNVTYDRVQNLQTGLKVTRMLPSELDVQFVLGNDAAAHRLKPELDEYGYQGVLHEMRFLTDAHPQEFWDATFYNGWLSTIRALNDTTDFEAQPEAMRTAAWADKNLNTQTASWAELRHDTLLYVKQSYSGGNGCEYPDAYVEPVPAFYARLAHLGKLGGELVADLDKDGFEVSRAQTFFADLSTVSATLETIAHKELEGATLTQAEFDFLRGTIEEELVGCGEVQYDGWYARLHYDAAKIGEFVPTIADVHTAPTDAGGTEKGWVLHAATGRPMLMVFTVPDCGGVKSYVGPISSFHSVLTEQYDRQTDSGWAEILSQGTPPRPSWTESFIR